MIVSSIELLILLILHKAIIKLIKVFLVADFIKFNKYTNKI